MFAIRLLAFRQSIPQAFRLIKFGNEKNRTYVPFFFCFW